jgi:RNA polymerase primary sigma factor
MPKGNLSTVIISQDEIGSYLKDIRKIEVLSDEQQKIYILQLKELKKNPDPLQYKKIEKKFVEGNLRFVISIAKEYIGKGMELCDLISEGNHGLIRAFEKFDPEKEIKFISYAVWWIRQGIRQAMYDHGRTIRLPVNIAQDVNKQMKKKISNDMEQELLFVMEEINPSNVPFCVNLDACIDGEDGDTLLDLIENKDAERPDAAFDSQNDVKTHIQNVLKVLDERERNIIEDYYGMSGSARTLEEIGEELCLTKERVRQIKDKALKKLRNEAESLFQYF